MKKIYVLLAFTAVLLTGCTKTELLPVPVDTHEWMRNRERGVVAYVDYSTGNYIIDTYSGYAVVEIQDGISPREYDEEYAFFSSRGFQTTYNYSGDYFTQVRVVESWLSWQDARYVLDQISNPY